MQLSVEQSAYTTMSGVTLPAVSIRFKSVLLPSSCFVTFGKPSCNCYTVYILFTSGLAHVIFHFSSTVIQNKYPAASWCLWAGCFALRPLACLQNILLSLNSRVNYHGILGTPENVHKFKP